MGTNFQSNLSMFLPGNDAASPLVDLSPNGNDFTVDGATLQDPAIDGSCVSYDETNDRCTRSNASQVGLDPTTGSFVIATKVLANLPGTTSTIMAKREATLGTTFYRCGVAASGKAFFAITSATGAAQAVINSTTTVGDGATIFRLMFVCDRDANLLRMFINGISDATAVDCSTVLDISNTDLVELGAASGASWYGGKMGKTLFWNGANFTAAQALEFDNGGNWPTTYAGLDMRGGGGDSNAQNRKNQLRLLGLP